MFYNIYIDLCKQKGISPSKAAEEMGFHRSSVTNWKRNGYTPRREILEKVSDFFHVSVDYLLGKTQQPNEYVLSGDDYPDVLKPFVMQSISRMVLSVDPPTGALASNDLANLLIDELKRTPANFDPVNKNSISELLTLLPPDVRDKQNTLYDVLNYIASSPEIMELLRNSGYNERGELTVPPEAFDKARLSWLIKDTIKNKKSSDIKSEQINDDVPSDLTPYLPTGKVAIYGQIPAGIAQLAVEEIEGYTYVDVPDPENHFALRVKGDSMVNAGIFPGDLVIIRYQQCADNGQIVACRINGDESTLKRFKQHGDTVVLMPENSKYEPIIVSCKEFEIGYASIIGVAVEVKRSLL